MTRKPDSSHLERQIDVTAYVCPVCLTVGRRNDQCPHYESGSVGWVYYTRMPSTIAVIPQGWEPVTTSLDSPAVTP